MRNPFESSDSVLARLVDVGACEQTLHVISLS